MQTFLASTDFAQSAKWLDDIRLNNQVNEALIVLRTLTGWYAERGRKGWPHHPVTKLWIGYVPALTDYISKCLIECQARGIGLDTLANRQKCVLDALRLDAREYGEWLFGNFGKPPWLTEEFASSHRAILLGKAKETSNIWYQQWNWPEEPAGSG